jgi:hypothetical protein
MMRVLREWLIRLASILRPSRRDDDLEAELQAHAALAAEDGRGTIGTSQAMESLRDQRGLPWLDDLRRDLWHGARTLARQRGFTITAVITLALGVGASAGVFTLLDQVLLRTLPVPEAERLVQVQWRGSKMGANYGSGSTVSYPFCRELEQQEIFNGVLCRYPTDVSLSTGGEPQLTRAEIVSGSYFEVLGVQPELGRLIARSDDRVPGAHAVVVLSHDYWSNRFGGALDIIGRRIWINAHPMTVIGIAASAFRGVDRAGAPAVWIPAMMKREATPEWDGLESRRSFWIHAIGRLRPDVTIEQARARLQPWFRRMLETDLADEEFPPVSPAQRRSFLASTLDVVSAARGVATLEARLDRPLRVLMAGAFLLVVLASLNVAGLLLARGLARTREVATRMAIGASRARVARQLLVESLLITTTAGALGVVLAPLVSRVLRSYVPQGADVSTALDGRVLLFALLVSALTGAICGLGSSVSDETSAAERRHEPTFRGAQQRPRRRSTAAGHRADRLRAHPARDGRPLRPDARAAVREGPRLRGDQLDDVQPRPDCRRIHGRSRRTGDARCAATAAGGTRVRARGRGELADPGRRNGGRAFDDRCPRRAASHRSHRLPAPRVPRIHRNARAATRGRSRLHRTGRPTRRNRTGAVPHGHCP